MTNKEKFIEQLSILTKAWGMASEIWEKMDNEDIDVIETGYPFKDSFDAMYYDLIAWKEEVESKVNPPTKKIFKVGVYEIWEQMHEVEASSESEARQLIQENESTVLEDQFCFVGFDNNPFHFYGDPK